MNTKAESVFNKQLNPFYQGLMILFLFLSLVAIVSILKYLQWIKFESIEYWKYATSIILFYIMMNCLFCFNSVRKMIYYRDSIITYVALVLIFSFICEWLSGINLPQADSYSWILTVFSIIYIVLITIINLSRKIVEIAIKQDNKLKNEK